MVTPTVVAVVASSNQLNELLESSAKMGLILVIFFGAIALYKNIKKNKKH